jgi:hypothetical protein
VLPEQTTQAGAEKAAAGGHRPATIALMNAYDSDLPWPEGTEITHLRVLQILPKSTPSRNTPRIGIAEQTNARSVLGTVPVESDGSAHFEVPPGKLIYFQAIDSRGMAIQSMRSATYVHPGERLICQGCHEHKHHAPSQPVVLPLALRRAPSELKPEVEGSNPFNYVRLVQPVLDRHCVVCHQEQNALDLTGAIQYRPCPRDKHKQCCYTRSYISLAEKYGFYFHAHSHWLFGSSPASSASRTMPGGFGARASKLLEYLGQSHYGVDLSEADFRRIVLWLDCNSEFLGAYEDAAAQARGELVMPRLD